MSDYLLMDRVFLIVGNVFLCVNRKCWALFGILALSALWELGVIGLGSGMHCSLHDYGVGSTKSSERL